MYNSATALRNYHFLKKLSTELSYDPAIALLVIYPREMKHIHVTDIKINKRTAYLYHAYNIELGFNNPIIQRSLPI